MTQLPDEPFFSRTNVSGLRNFGILYLAASICVALLALVFGQIDFGGYDCSMLIDVAWRMHLGQHPYVDFPCLLPPSFYLASWLAMELFGVHWWAFTLGGVVLFLSLSGLGWWAASRAFAKLDPRMMKLVLIPYLAAIATPTLATIHLWHSVIAILCVTALMMVYVCLFEVWGRTNTVDLPLLFACIGLTGITALSKPNTAFAAILMTLAFPLWQRLRRASAVTLWSSICGAGFLLALGILVVFKISPLAVLHSYTEVSGRPDPWTLLGTFFMDDQPLIGRRDAGFSYLFAGAGLLMGLFVILRSWRFIPRTAVPSFVIGVVITSVAFASDWDIRSNALAPVIFGSGLLIFSASSFAKEGSVPLFASKWVPGSMLLILCIAEVGLSAGRARMKSVGPWATAIAGPHSLHYDPFFGPFYGRREFWSMLQEMDGDLSGVPHMNIFFGPRLEFEYARAGIPSPRNMPIWWHPGSSYPSTDESKFVDVAKQDRFSRLLFFDTMRFPQNLRRYWWSHYCIATPAYHSVEEFHLCESKEGQKMTAVWMETH